jgi:hypothetical protein
MKTPLPAYAVLICTVLMLNSCTVSNNSIASQKEDFENLNESGTATCFIQLKDGTIKHYKTLQLVTGVLTSPHLLADNKEIIKGKDIIAYQNHKHYAVSSQYLTSKKNPAVASETLPGFAVKVLSGKLNVYCRKFYNGSNTVNEYFLQHGKDGNIVSYSNAVLKNIIKEDAKALEYFKNKIKTTSKFKKILTVVEMYNNGQMLTKN